MPIGVNLFDFILKNLQNSLFGFVFLFLGSQLTSLFTLDYTGQRWKNLIKNCYYYAVRLEKQLVLKYQDNS